MLVLLLALFFTIIVWTSDSFISPKIFGSGLSSAYQPNKRSSNSRLDGIPKLFRWMVELYPDVLESVESSIVSMDGIDNFYLDMNGIIHTCTHANKIGVVNLTESQMFKRIFDFTDSLYKMVKPNKLMFLAIDGVAPRAKMNQQRSRRFRAVQDRELHAIECESLGIELTDDSFDSNCITPGTEFMHRLGVEFQNWIKMKLNTDSFWQNRRTQIVYSGADVPGEGEHKIMSLIRSLMKLGPLTDHRGHRIRHCMYGLDADLIMLSLVTHEPRFVLLREKINQNKDVMQWQIKDFESIEISTFRSLLDKFYRNVKFSRLKSTLKNAGGRRQVVDPKYDVNRIIDDFVFMCFFIGNDFLPSLPHLDIHQGSINSMMDIYLQLMPTLGGYLVNSSSLHLPRIELFAQEVARSEKAFFQQRAFEENIPDYDPEKYREEYYRNKFGILPGDEASIRKIVQSYVEGLFWVQNYYHEGCMSWTWYYPYLYAPLASDLIHLPEISVQFHEGRPFTPLLQLLSVLPPQSMRFLPQCYAWLVLAPNSPLAPYYPYTFSVDANGKKNAWESVVHIPFLNESLVLDLASSLDHQSCLSTTEKLRNVLGKMHVYTSNNQALTVPSSNPPPPPSIPFSAPRSPAYRFSGSSHGVSNRPVSFESNDKRKTNLKNIHFQKPDKKA